MSESRSEADITDTSDRSGPECREVLGGSCRRAPVARVPVRIQHRTVESAVSEPQAAACKFARVPEYPWRVRPVETPVRERSGHLVIPIVGRARMWAMRELVDETES